MKNTIEVKGCHYMKSAIKCVYIWQDNHIIDHDIKPDFQWRFEINTIDNDRNCYKMGSEGEAKEILERVLKELNS